MAPYPIQGSHVCWLGESAGAKNNADLTEKDGCSTDTEVMTRKAERGEGIFGKIGQKIVASKIGHPELEECWARRHCDQAFLSDESYNEAQSQRQAAGEDSYMQA